MRFVIAILSLALLGAAPSPQAIDIPKWFSESFTEFLADQAKGEPGPALELPRLLAKGKPVLVVVARKGCRECEELEREAFTRPEVKRSLAAFTLERQNLAGEWARANRIIYTPSLVFLDKDGKEVFRAEGYVRPFHIASAMDYVAGGAYLREPSFQRYIQDRADKLRADGQKVDIWR